MLGQGLKDLNRVLNPSGCSDQHGYDASESTTCTWDWQSSRLIRHETSFYGVVALGGNMGRGSTGGPEGSLLMSQSNQVGRRWKHEKPVWRMTENISNKSEAESRGGTQMMIQHVPANQSSIRLNARPTLENNLARPEHNIHDPQAPRWLRWRS